MKKTLKQGISILLVVVMLLASMPLAAAEGLVPTEPQGEAEAAAEVGQPQEPAEQPAEEPPLAESPAPEEAPAQTADGETAPQPDEPEAEPEEEEPETPEAPAGTVEQVEAPRYDALPLSYEDPNGVGVTLVYTEVTGGVEIVGFEPGTGSALIIPDTIGGDAVVSIGVSAFASLTGISSAQVGAVAAIGVSAFPASVTEIHFTGDEPAGIPDEDPPVPPVIAKGEAGASFGANVILYYKTWTVEGELWNGYTCLSEPEPAESVVISTPEDRTTVEEGDTALTLTANIQMHAPEANDPPVWLRWRAELDDGVATLAEPTVVELTEATAEETIALTGVSAGGLTVFAEVCLQKMVPDPDNPTYMIPVVDGDKPVLDSVILSDSIGITVTPAPTSMTIVGEKELWVKDYGEYTYTVEMKPGDILYKNVTWSVESDDAEFVDPDKKPGVLKLNADAVKGTVTIKATSKNEKFADAPLSATLEIEVVEFEVVLDQNTPESMSSGQTVQLAASLRPTSLRNETRIIWSLSEESLAYADITETGLLTAKAGILEPQTITVTAAGVNGLPTPASCTITIKPIATQVDIYDDPDTETADNKVTGKEIQLDLNADPDDEDYWSGQLYAAVKPITAEAKFVWTSDRPDIATVSASGLVTPVRNINGKYTTGLVTIKAAAADGSGKSAVVYVRIVRLPKALEILSDLDVVGDADGKLPEGKTATLWVEFAEPEPDDKRVTWSLTDESKAYARLETVTGTLPTRAKLTALDVTEEVTVTVQCKSVNGKEATPLVITIKPLTDSIVIKDEQETVVNDTTFVVNLDNQDTATLAFTASFTPEDATPEILWTASDYNGKDQEDNDVYTFAKMTQEGDGITLSDFNVGQRGATVTYTATAQDGSGLTAAFKVKYAHYATAVQIQHYDADLKQYVEMPDGLAFRGGDSVALKAALDPEEKTLTDKAVVWELLDDESKAYASINGSGRLSTKTVYEEKTITATVTVKEKGTADEPATDTVTILLKPSATKVTISYDDRELEPNELLPLEIDEDDDVTAPAPPEALPTLTLKGAMWPEGAKQGVSWKSSNEKLVEIIAVNDEEGTCTIAPYYNPAKKLWYNTGTATVTAIAKDGSGRKASVKIKVDHFVKDVAILSKAKDADGAYITDPELASGRRFALQAVCTPTSATLRTVTWSLANPDDAQYCTVGSTGVVTAKAVYAEHEVGIIATAKDGGGAVSEAYNMTIVPATQKFLIMKATQTELEYDATDVTRMTLLLRVGETIDFVGESYDGDGEVKLTASPANGALRKTDNGLAPESASFLAIKPGTVVVKATAKGYTAATVTIKVAAAYVADIDVESKAKSKTQNEDETYDVHQVVSGKTLALKATAKPTEAANRAVTWEIWKDAEGTVACNDLATISASGVVKAIADLESIETVYAIAKAKDGRGAKSAAYAITIIPATVAIELSMNDKPVTGMTLRGSIDAGLKLTATLYLFGGDKKSSADDATIVTWTSSNNKIAEVLADGTMELKKSGTVTITAKDSSGKSASFKLTVFVPVESIAISLNDKLPEVRAGGSLQLIPVFNDGDADRKPSIQAVVWTVSPQAYATITPSGLVRAKKVTSAKEITVTLTSADPDYAGEAQTVTITIKPSVSKVDILEGSEVLTGKTRLIDLTALESDADEIEVFELTAANNPSTAMEGWTWTTSSVAAAGFRGDDGDVVAKRTAEGVTIVLKRNANGKFPTGMVTITAKATDGSGKSAFVKLNITRLVSSIVLTPASSPVIKAGGMIKINATVNPANAANKRITWSLAPEDQQYAFISQTGHVTVKKTAPAREDIRVIATAQDGSEVTGSATIYVLP